MRGLLIIGPVDPRRQSKRWPAIMLAVNRMARVKGRIIRLIDSINTINGISEGGVPEGVRWASKLFKYLVILKIIIDNQRVSERAIQNLICLVAVKI